jgi:hypothetical protein
MRFHEFVTEEHRHGYYAVYQTLDNGHFEIIGHPTKYSRSAMGKTFDFLRATGRPVKVDIKDHIGTFDSVIINPGDHVKNAIMKLGFIDDSPDMEVEPI